MEGEKRERRVLHQLSSTAVRKKVRPEREGPLRYERIIFVFRIFLIELSKPLCFLSINEGDKGLMGDCCSPGHLYFSLYSSWFTSIKSDALNTKLTTLSLHVTFMQVLTCADI